MAVTDNIQKKKSMDASYLLEALEPRIMLSADPFGAAEAAVDLLVTANQQGNIEYEDDTSSDTPDSANRNISGETLESLDLASVTTLFSSADPLTNHPQSYLQPSDGDFVSTPENENSRTELIIIDAAVSDQQQLLKQIMPSDSHVSYQVHYLNQNSDGITQISELLNQYSQIDAVHILSHGSGEGLQLGSAWINADTLNQQADQITQWSSVLTDNADVLLYGCDVTSSEAGINFVQTLQHLSGADVAASDDKTGAQALGGDWDLEYQSGVIEAQLAFNAESQQNWQGVLDIFTVNNNSDTIDVNLGDGNALDGSGNTTLRAAIMEANFLGGSHTINLDADTYTLAIGGKGDTFAATGDLDITADITLTGAGVDQTTINAAGVDRIFDVQIGGSLTVSDLKLQGGEVTTGVFENGGALRIAAGATVTASDVEFSGNTARAGGAISNIGTLNLYDSTVDSNSSAFQGGGIDSTGTATLERVTVSDNTNTGSQGGGIRVGNGGFTATNLTVSGNSSASDGGGIYTLRPITLVNATITDNTATWGSGIYTQGAGSVDLSNTIVAGNNTSSDVYGAFISSNNNLIGNVGINATGLSNGVNGDQVGSSGSLIDPLLGALQDNGGPTFTHALLAGSLAIDAGNNTGAPAVDQRGLTRIGTVDIGAYELESLSLLLSTNGSATYDGGAVGNGNDIVAFIDPNLNLELGDGSSGVTDGTFSVEHSLPENVRAMHYVNSVVAVDTNTVAGGLGTYELQPGQIVLSMRAADTNDFSVPTLDGGTLTVNNTDVLVYTPSTGTYEMLLEDAILKPDLSAANIHAITIVEQATTIGVDTTLVAGTYLIARSDPAVHSDISTYDNTNGRQDLLLGAAFLSDAEHIQGLELLEAEVILGSATLAQGTLLITVNSSMTVGTGTTVSTEQLDVIALTVNATQQDSVTPDTHVDAQIVLDGSDIGLNINSSKEINGLTLVGNNLAALTNSEPTLTATGNNPSFTEGDAAVNLFSGAMVDTIESGQSLIGMELTVSNVSGTADEIITIDGSAITLTNGTSGTTAGSSLNYSVSVSGSLATVILSAAPGVVDESAAQNLVDAISYQTVSDDPGSSDRVITITELQDSGGTANGGDDTAALSIASTVTMTPVNDEPIVTSTALDPTFNEGGAAVSIFTATTVDPIEVGQNLSELWISVTNVSEGADEVVNIDGASIALNIGNSGTTTNFSYSVINVLGVNVITLTGGSVSSLVLEGIINDTTYQNNSTNPTEASRVISISGLRDSGGTADGGDDFNIIFGVSSNVAVTAVNNIPVVLDNTLSINQGSTVVVSSLDLAATDAESDDTLLTFNVTNITNGHFALSSDTSSAITSFTQSQITAGVIVFVHDGGELAPAYDISVFDGALSSELSSAIITFTDTSEGVLWLSTVGSEGPSNGIPGLNSSNVDRGDILQQAGPNFVLGGSTNGTFSVAFDISLFSSEDTINGLHYVTSNITMGQGNVVNLQAGDVLLSSSGSMTLTSNGVSAPVPGIFQKEDVFYFRPDTPGDYSKGDFYLLFTDGMGTGAEIQAITLVEQNVTVGDYLLEAGDILFGRDGGNEKNDIWLFRTAAIDMAAPSSSYPAALKLIEGDNAGAGFDASITGLDVLESDLVIGGQSYDAGTVLVSFDADDTSVGTTSQSVTKHDVVALNVSQTTVGILGLELGFAQLEASILFDGSNVGFNSSNETLDGFSLTTGAASINTPPSLDGNNFVFTEGGTTTITLAMLSASDGEDADAGLAFDISLLTGGQFELASNAAVAITSFTQNQVAIGDVVFVDNGDESAPTFSLSVSDGVNTTAVVAATINFSNSNDDPTLNNAIGDQAATEDSAFSFTFAAGTFGDVDVGDSLTYSASLSSGLALPSWLAFDGTSRTFSGTPLNGDVGTLTIEISADDGNGGRLATDQFDLVIANSNDKPTGSVIIISDGIPAENKILTVSNTISDEDGLGAITYHWQRDGNDVGVTGSSYLLTDADLGKDITVEARYTDATGVTENLSSLPLTIIKPANDPVVTVSDSVVSSSEEVVFLVTNIAPEEEVKEAKDPVVASFEDVEPQDPPQVVHSSPAVLEVPAELPSFASNEIKPNNMIKPLALAIGNQTAVMTDLRASWVQLSDPLMLVNSSGLMHGLDEMEKEFQKQISLDQMVIGSGIAMSTSLSVGYVAWLLRSGVLLSSVLTSLPAWRFVDPLPILSKLDSEDDEFDVYETGEESLEELVQKDNPDKTSDTKDH